MYFPAQTEERDLGVLHALMRSHPLGTWITNGDEGLTANHIPFLLRDADASNGTLVGHVARANPVWKSLSNGLPSLVIFQGADSYISPSWYPGKHAHGKAVPTWNYIVVHAHGVPRVIDDVDWLLQHVTQLSDEHEAAQAMPWKVADAPVDYIDKMRRAIVGIEIPITTLMGKWKIGKNRPVADQQGTVAGLQMRGTDDSRALARVLSASIITDQ